MNPFYHHRFRKRADGGDVRRNSAFHALVVNFGAQ